MMDHALRSISYIADIGDLVVLMARRRITQTGENGEPVGPTIAKTPKMICHIFESEEVSDVAERCIPTGQKSSRLSGSVHGICQELRHWLG